MAEKRKKPKPYEMLPWTDIKRKPGAQPGNLNAWKHGFYSRRFKALELSDLGAVLQDDMTDEIALIRVVMRRVFDMADEEAKTLNDWEDALSILGAASTRLAGILRTNHAITGKSQGDIVDVLAEAIGEISHELGFSKLGSN